MPFHLIPQFESHSVFMWKTSHIQGCGGKEVIETAFDRIGFNLLMEEYNIMYSAETQVDASVDDAPAGTGGFVT